MVNLLGICISTAFISRQIARAGSISDSIGLLTYDGFSLLKESSDRHIII